MDIQYVGEHLFWGYAGRMALFVAFFTALFSTIAYYLASGEKRKDYRQWRAWARRSFRVHSLMVGIASFALMFILLNHYYEYRYVWINVENDLPLGYKIASFWAGQEGSLLFWALCQVAFGLLLIRFARRWEAPVMTIFSFSQVFMLSMLLGIRFGGVSIGMDPFLLLRLAPENIDNHFFHNPEYLSMITDGNGLNPLLRNFWMMSHPPVTFIGYAAVLVPFCYAVAALWRRKFHDWIRPALPWTILGVLTLGAGILLGGVWAYESLTFGGFWAWDPIENASLVPWLVLVAGLHLMLVSRKKRHTYFPAFLFILLSFVLVVYASYLTRSGVLSETSVHSFGRDGMGLHIFLYMFVFLVIGLFLLLKHYRRLPGKESEHMFTREFWLFVGSLVLVLSAFQIIFSTSIPVFNQLLGTNMAPPVDVAEYYNRWQLPFAVVIGLLIGVTHFIRWGKNDSKTFRRRIAFSLILSVVVSVPAAIFYGFARPDYLLMLFASLFALFSSLDMLFRFRGKLMDAGPAISHLAMALFLLAVLLTFSQKTVISENTSGYRLGEDFSETENLLLVKGEVLPMGEYHVTYAGREFDGERIHYQVDFLKTNSRGEYYKVFSSYPAVLLNERMGNVYEPYARVSPLRDVFTYITYADLETDPTPGSYALLDEFSIAVGDTVEVDNNHLIFRDIQTSGDLEGSSDVRVTAVLELQTGDGQSFTIDPSYMIEDGRVMREDYLLPELDQMYRFGRVSDEPYTIEMEVYEDQPEFIVIKTIIFPMINLLWISIVVLMIGLWISFRSRWRNMRREKTKS